MHECFRNYFVHQRKANARVGRLLEIAFLTGGLFFIFTAALADKAMLCMSLFITNAAFRKFPFREAARAVHLVARALRKLR